MWSPECWRPLLAAVLIACVAPSLSTAQGAGSIGIRVTEAAGMRRIEYPVGVRVSVPRGRPAEPSGARLRLGDTLVPAQYAVLETWPDGAPRELGLHFNASLAPGETRLYRLDFSGGESAPPVARGLTLTEEGDAIHVGNMTFGRPGMPLILSAFYARQEFIGTFDDARNGFAIVDDRGNRHELSAAAGARVEIVARGPLFAALRYAGDIQLGGGDSASLSLTVEMPNSKSWVRLAAGVSDPAGRVRALVLDTPLRMGAFPWTWDLGTATGSYGAFRSAADAVTYRQVIEPASHSWTIETGTAAEARLYETATSGPRGLSSGWGHLVGEGGAVAFGIERLAENRGTYTVTFDGQGQTSYRFSPAEGAGPVHELVVYQHFVSLPVAIGAATSPASMLEPPVVTVEP